jgi:hypothetical protein
LQLQVNKMPNRPQGWRGCNTGDDVLGYSEACGGLIGLDYQWVRGGTAFLARRYYGVV